MTKHHVDSDIHKTERMIKQRLRVAHSERETKIFNVAKRILLDNIETRITMQDLCQSVASNPSTLSKLFNQNLQQSPFAWLKKERLRLAAKLLRTTDYAIYQIAHAVGYLDANNFSTAFRQYFGLSPKAFRKSKTGNKKAKVCIA